MINFLTYFSNKSYDVPYCPIKFELNTQLECGETKKIQILSRGRLDQLKYL